LIKNIILILSVSFCLSFASAGTCSAQTLMITQEHATELLQILNQLEINNNQQATELKIVKEQLNESKKLESLTDSQILLLKNQLTKSAQTISQAQNSLDAVNKSFAEYSKEKNREIKILKVERAGLIGILAYALLK